MAERGAFEIFATHGVVSGKATVRVYLACDENAARAAVAGNTFKGVWNGNRMSWVKPSATWMAYRCGWTELKDRKQTNVIALDVDQQRFEDLLLQAVVSGDHLGVGVDGDRCKESPVVVQWDPERELDPSSVEKRDSPYLRKLSNVRSLQIGLRGSAWQRLFTDEAYVLRVSDMTPSFRAAHAALKAGDLLAARAALWPSTDMEERRYEPSAEIRQTLHISAATEAAAASGASAPGAESMPTDLLAAIASHAADPRDVASLASATKETREATAVELAERRRTLERKKAAMMAKLRSELLIVAPYEWGDTWVEAIEQVQLRRLSDEHAKGGSASASTRGDVQTKEQWSATWLRVLHYDGHNYSTQGHAVGLGYGMHVPQEVWDHVEAQEAMSRSNRHKRSDKLRFRERRTLTYDPVSGALAWDGDLESEELK